jgi:lipopolysaccharide exporter
MMPAEPQDASMRARFARSVRWSYGSAALGAVLQLGLAALMARMLDPTAFGLMAIANGVLRYLRYITDLGIGSVAARADRFDAEDRGILTAAALMVSLVLLGTIWLAGPALVAIIPSADPDALPVLRILAVTLVLATIGDTAAAGLRRDLDFRHLSLAGLAALVGGQGLVAVPLAAMGAGVWALVAGTLVQTAIQSLLLIAHRPVRRGPMGKWLPRARNLLKLGGGFLALRLLDAAFNQIPPLALGVWIGMAAAGYYDRAFVLAVVPLELVAGSLGKVLHPTFGSLGRDHRHALGDAFAIVLRAIPCLTFPLAAGIALAAPLLIQVVLGPGWDNCANLVALLAIAAAIRSVASLTGSLVEACGAVRLHSAHRLSTIILLLLWLSWSHPTTAEGVLSAVTVMEGISATILLFLAAQPSARSMASLALALLPALFPTALVAIAVTGMARLHAPPVTALAASMAAAALALVIGLIFNPSPALRRTLGTLVLGELMAVPIVGRHPLSKLRRWLSP